MAGTATTDRRVKTKFPPGIQALLEAGDIKLGSDPSLILQFIPTGIQKFDDMLGGGFVRGCTSLLYGDYSTGKTLLALMTIANVQRAGGLCAFIDAEQTFNPTWAEQVGVDTDQLLVSRPKTGEKTVDVVTALLKTNEINLMVIDSLAAMVPTAEAEDDTEKWNTGQQAKLITKGLRRILANNKDTCVICINHVRSNISVPGDAIPGGRGQKQYTITMVKVSRKEWIKGGRNKTQRVGFVMRVELKKTKTSPPEQECSLPFHFDDGAIDILAVDIDYAIELGIIEQRTAIYRYDEETFKGKTALYDHISEDDKRWAKLRQEIRRVIDERSTVR